MKKMERDEQKTEEKKDFPTVGLKIAIGDFEKMDVISIEEDVTSVKLTTLMGAYVFPFNQ